MTTADSFHTRNVSINCAMTDAYDTMKRYERAIAESRRNLYGNEVILRDISDYYLECLCRLLTHSESIYNSELNLYMVKHDKHKEAHQKFENATANFNSEIAAAKIMYFKFREQCKIVSDCLHPTVTDFSKEVFNAECA